MRSDETGSDRPLPDSTRGFRLVGAILSALVSPFVRFDLPPSAALPTAHPVLWAPNHRSMFDTAVGLIGLYRLGFVASFFVTASYFETPVVGRLLTMIGAIPVEAEKGALRAISLGVERLRAGNDLVIMAEGKLVAPEDRQNGIGPLEPGVTVLARRASVPVVPTALIGADDILPVGARFPRLRVGRRRTMLVRFGQPIPVDGSAREALDELAQRLSELVLEAEAEHARMAS